MEGQGGALDLLKAAAIPERGSRPAAPRDGRYACAYRFGAVCPARGIGAVLVLPYVNTSAVNLHLSEISRHVTPDARAMVTLRRRRLAPARRPAEAA